MKRKICINHTNRRKHKHLKCTITQIVRKLKTHTHTCLCKTEFLYIQKHVQTIVEPIMNSLGLEDEGDHLEK